MGDRLRPIESLDGWVSPRLGIRFDVRAGMVRLWHGDGTPFETFSDVARRAREAAEKAEAEQQRAEAERRRAEAERRRADTAETRARQLREKLLALGVDPDQA